MGMFKHHTIIVTGWSRKATKRARRRARRLFYELVSKIVESPLNGFWTFIIAPDGSKEEWDESFAYDRRRAAYVAWLSRHAHDGSSLLDWVEIQYGDEYGRPSEVISDSVPPSEGADDDIPI
jgi:hypothetical protein